MEGKHGTLVSVTEHISEVTEDLYQLQQNDVLCDVILKADDGNVPAHAVVLSAVSPYLKRIITSTCVCTPNVLISVRGFNVECLKNVLRYMYTGKIFISTSNVRSVTSCFRQMEMYSQIKKIMKNFPMKDSSFLDCDTGHKENKMSGVEEKKSLINIPWSERLRKALRETNSTNIIQETEEKLCDVLDILKKSVESVPSVEERKEKPITPPKEEPVSVDINTSASVFPESKATLSVDINSSERNKMFGTRKREKNEKMDEPVEKAPKLGKHSCMKVMSKIGGDFRRLFAKREIGLPEYEEMDDSDSTCESDIYYTSDSNDDDDEDDDDEPITFNRSDKIEVVSGMQKSLDFVTDSKNRLHFFSNQNMAVENESCEIQNLELGPETDVGNSKEKNAIDDSLSSLSEDIGLLGVALTKGFLNKEPMSVPEKCINPKTPAQDNTNMMSPMSEMSANYTSETYFSQASLLSDGSGHQTSHFSDTNLDQVPVSPDEVNACQASYLSESSMYHNPMLSDASTDLEKEKTLKRRGSKNGTHDICQLEDFMAKDDVCIEHQKKPHAEQDHLAQKAQKNEQKIDQAGLVSDEHVRSSLVSTMNLLDTNEDMDNPSQCNLDNSYNFSLSSEILNSYQQTGTDGNPDTENQGTNNIYINTTDLSGHHIVEHFQNIDQLEMTPELLEAVVNPDFVQHFSNENVVSISQPEIVGVEPQEIPSSGQQEQVILKTTYDNSQPHSGKIIIQACEGDQNQSEQIVIHSDNVGNAEGSQQQEHILIQSQDATLDANPNQSQEIIIQASNQLQLSDHPQMEHIIIQTHDGTDNDITGEMEHIIIQAEDGTILKSGQVSDNIFDRIKNYTVLSQGNADESAAVVKELSQTERNESIFNIDDIKHTGFKKITRCRTCGIDFHTELSFKLHRKNEHPIAHMTWLRRAEKRKQLEQLLSRIDHLKRLKDSDKLETNVDYQASNNALKYHLNQTLNEVARENDDAGDEAGYDDDDGGDATYVPSEKRQSNRTRGITRCRTCKIEFHSEIKFQRHRKEMHPIAHMTWLKRNEVRQKGSEKMLESQSSKDLYNRQASTGGSMANKNVLESNIVENEEAGNVLGKIIEKMDQADDENEDVEEETQSEDESNSSVQSDELDSKVLSSPVNITCRIRRVTYCRTCGINFETTDQYKEHRKRVHPLAHKNWLARNAVRQKINNLIRKRAKKSGKRCRICGQKFSSTVLLREHQNTIHTDVKYSTAGNENEAKTDIKCLICNHICNDNQSLLEHREKYHPLINDSSERKELLECDICDFTAKEMHVMIQHKNGKHQQGTEDEHIEQEVVSSEQEANEDDQEEDENKSEKEGPLSCCLCSFEADSEQEVILHVQNVHSNTASGYKLRKGFKCSQCDYTASNNARLNAHMIKHSDSNANKRLQQYLDLDLLEEKVIRDVYQLTAKHSLLDVDML